MASPDELDRLRAELDTLDRGLVDLVARRLEVVAKVGEAKRDTDRPVRDLARERAVLDRVEALARDRGVSPDLVRRVFREVIGHAVDRQNGALLTLPAEPVEVAVVEDDPVAAHAARKHLSGLGVRGEVRTRRGPRGVVAAVERGECALAVLPVESSVSGSVGLLHELLERSTLYVVGEEVWRVEHCLVGTRELPVDDVATVVGTDEDTEACAGFLDALPHATSSPVGSAAEALQRVRDDATGCTAALLPVDAVPAEGVVVLRRDVADVRENVTRLLVLARHPVDVPPRVPCKTTLRLVTAHAEGALLRCLAVLSDAGLTMTKLESRPVPGRPFEYAFFVDVEGNVADPATSAAFDRLRAVATTVRVLGSYPAKVLHSDALTTPR
ncbi:MAG: chorismate mutase / prephenate dehydratase [Frankiales bacterium]|nr:chorismate mutase / prephenate dehydratase [Frankiales bacterium]